MFECLTQKEKEQLLFTLKKINNDWENRFSFDSENIVQDKIKR